jgi:hypothetical protein
MKVVSRGFLMKKAALEIVRLLAEFRTDEDREDAIADIRAILKVRADRAKNRRPGMVDRGVTRRSKPAGRAMSD